ncbi:MAG TPA: LysR family transcriptional regulator, partial [Archangium sp.]|nr:LysR family transcriptional regulator [Archangium sp.]
MSSDPGTPTLDQLRVFLTVVEVGSFAGAARHLGRATSVISYTIANLEAQLGVSLFDRESTRKPQLTEAGRTVLAEARTVSNGVDGLRAKVKGLLQGLEAELRVALDVMLPASRVVDALKSFREESPTVSLYLYMEALGAVTDIAVVATRTWRLADLGSKHMLLREGIGWGNMPEPMVREDLESGRLVHLDMPDYK